MAQSSVVYQGLGFEDGLLLQSFHRRNVASLVFLSTDRCLLLGVGGKLFLVDSELNGIGLGSRSKVVHTSLESLLPGVEVHRSQLLGGRIGNVNIQTLTLANVWRTVGGQVQDDSLRNLPDSLVDVSEVLWDFFNLLDGSTVRNDLVAEGLVPDSEGSKITQQVLVDDGEFSGQDTSVVNVGGEGFGTLVVSKNLGSGGGGHGCDKQRVAQSVLGNLCLEAGPVPSGARGDAPEVELKLALARWRTGVTLVVTFGLGKSATGRAGTKVDGLEDVSVQLSSLGRVKGDLEHSEGVGKTLDTKTDRTVLQVRVAGLFDGVEVAVDDSVQVAGKSHGNLAKLLEIELKWAGRAETADQLGKTDAGKVANGGFVFGCVLNNFGTEVGALDGSKVLLVGLAVAVILVEHVGGSSLNLCVQDGEPQLLGLDGFASLTLTFVLLVEGLEFFSVAVGKARTFIGAHEGPLSIGLDTFHEQVRNPEGVEQVTGAVGLVTVVLSEVQKGEDIGVPWLEVDGNTSLALTTSLIDIAGSVVEDTKHRDDSVGSSVGSTNVGLASTNVVSGQTNSTGVLRDDGTVLEGIVNSIDGVLLHGQEKARRHLRSVGSGVEKGRSGVSEVSLGEAFVGVDDTVNVVSVDSNGNTHQHALGPFGDLSVHLEQIGLFQSLVTKVVVFEIPCVVDGFVKDVLVLHNGIIVFLGDEGTRLVGDWMDVVEEFRGKFRKGFDGRFLEVGNGDSSGKDRVIRVLGGEGCGGLGSKSFK